MSNPVLTEQQAEFIRRMKAEHQPQEQTMNQETKPEIKVDRRKFPIENRGINESIRKFFAKNRHATIADAVAATGATLSTVYNVRYALRKQHPRYFDVKKNGSKPTTRPVEVKTSESYLTQPIEVLGLPVRPTNCLKLVDVYTVGDLIQKRRIDLQFISGMGDKSIGDVENALKKVGLSLKSRSVGDPAPLWTPPPVPPMPEIVSPAPDMVNHPAHYKSGGIETIDFIEAKKLNYNLGNVVKYITRADLKGNRKQDLQKAAWYLQREIENGGQA